LKTIADCEGSITTPVLLLSPSSTRAERPRERTTQYGNRRGTRITVISETPARRLPRSGGGSRRKLPRDQTRPSERRSGAGHGGAAKEPILGGPETELPVSPRGMARVKMCRVLFAGRGYATWEEEIQKTVEELNPGRAMAEIANHGYQGSALYLDGDRLVVVRKGPGDLAKRKGRKVWLDWWTGLQPEIRRNWGKIKMLISPNDEYDGWIKFVGGVMGITVSCRNPAVRSVLNHVMYREVLEALVEYQTGSEAKPQTYITPGEKGDRGW